MLLLRGMFVFSLVDWAWPKSDWTCKYTSVIGKLRCTPLADKLWGKALESTSLEKFPPCLFISWTLKGNQWGFPEGRKPCSHKRLRAAWQGLGLCTCQPCRNTTQMVGRWVADFRDDSVSFFSVSARKEDFLLSFLCIHCFIIPVLSTQWLWVVIRKTK